MNRTTTLWLSMFLLSALVHAVAAFSILYDTNTEIHSGDDQGEDGIDVGFGQVGTYLEAREQYFNARKETTAEEVKKKVIPEKQPEPEEAKTSNAPTAPTKQVKKEASAPKIEPQKNVHNKTKVIVAKQSTVTNSEQENMDATTPEKVAAIKPSKPDAKLTKKEVASTVTTNKTRATGSRSNQTTGSKKGSANRYFGRLKSWLNQHKKYPPQLRKHKIQGVVTVRFTIDKTGALVKSSIKQSSGHEELDTAALELLENASPMPSFPTTFNREQLTISLPIEYALIDE